MTSPTYVDEKPVPLIRAGWIRAAIFFIAFFVIVILIQVGDSIVLALTSQTSEPRMESSLMMILEAASFLILFLLVILFRKGIDRRSVRSLGFSFPPAIRRDFLAGVLTGIALQAAIVGFLCITGDIEVTGVRFSPVPLITILFTLIFAGLKEEIVMRGYMLSNLMESMNKYVALFIVSSIFAILHILNPDASVAGVANIVLAGLLLGIYYVHRRNLWFPIGLHIAWNYCEGPIFGSPVSGVKVPSILQLKFIGNPAMTGGNFGFEASAAAAVLTLVALLLVHYVFKPKPTTPASTTL